MADESVTGTTPLPVVSAGSPVRLWFDVEAVASQAQQPQTQQIANFDAKANEDCINGNTLAVNSHFVVYTVKNGLIRVLHRHSTIRTLLRAHQGERVTDIRFYQDGDVLATVGSNDELHRSTIVVWRLYERQPEIQAEKLLEIVSVKTCMTRVLWHPFNPNQFWMVHTNAIGNAVASLVETTKVRTHPHDNYVACDFFSDYVISENSICLAQPEFDLTDISWSLKDPNHHHILTTHSSGDIILWDLKQLAPRGDGTLAPAQVQVVHHSQPVTRCFFLPHDDVVGKKRTSSALTTCFATASQQNAEITLWSPFFDWNKETNAPMPIQVLALEQPSPSYILNVVFGITPPNAAPLSSFLVMADRHTGNVLAFHLKAQWEEAGKGAVKKHTYLVGADYVVPFKTRFPIFSWSVQYSPTADITEEELADQGGLVYDIKLFAYQSKLVQCLTLTSYMCLPPEYTWVDPTPGVRVERMYPVDSAHVSVVDDDDDDDDDDNAVEVTAVACAQEEGGQEEEEEADDEAAGGDAIQYDEDYDYVADDDDDEGGEEEQEGAAEPALPDTSNLADNPFANWLGAIAAKSFIEGDKLAPPPLPPVPMGSVANQLPTPANAKKQLPNNGYVVPVVTAPPARDLPAPDGEPLAFLSPSDFAQSPDAAKLKHRPPTLEPAPDKKQDAAGSGKKGSAGKKSKSKATKSPKRGGGGSPYRRVTNDGPQNITILKRDVTPAAAAAVAATPAPPPLAVTPAPTAAPPVDIAAEIRQAVQDEMKNTVLLAIRNTIKETLESSVIKPLQVSINEIAKQGVKVDHNKISASLASSVDQPLRMAFADSMKNVFIPTLESVTGQILEKLSENLANSTAETNGHTNKEIAAMSSQLSTMTELVAELTREVRSLRESLSRQTSVHQHGEAPQPPPPPVNPVEAVKADIRRFLAERNYESAFTKAVSQSTAEMVVFCCAHSDVNEVLNGTKIQLSQPIILCLIQQLGTVVASSRASDLKVELDWLQDLALSLDPNNAQIRQHVPRVLHQLDTSINQRIAGSDPSLRRPLQRLLSIVRGIRIPGQP